MANERIYRESAQVQTDEEMVIELEEAVSLPEGKGSNFLYAEVDRVFVRETKKKRDVKKTERMTQILHQVTRPSIGTKQGLYTAHSTALDPQATAR